ncbi:MAG: hypothetical protein R2834_18660 [Rhodothermales bacterium]
MKAADTYGWRVLALTLLLVASCARPAETPAPVHGRVLYNLDSSQFFIGTFGPIEGATIDRFVDEYAALGITDLFVNVNAQRTNYASAAWESGWEGEDTTSVEWIRNERILHEQGVDYPGRMLQRAREAGIGAWISVRMNDAHLPDQPDHPLHSRFWRAHPEWRLENTGLDYAEGEVRDHYLALIREVSERYDPDGIELDFLRFPLYFRPGEEAAGVPLMTALVREARAMTDAAGQRLGRPVHLAVRVPTSPHVSLAHGHDVVAWAREGLVDLVIAAPWWSSANSDIRVEDWKAALAGTDVPVAVSLEDGVDAGSMGRRTLAPDEMRGILASAWDRGADAVYFFNLFTDPLRDWPREAHDRLVQAAGHPEALAAAPRRHVVTLVAPWAEGEPRARSVLPFTGTSAVFQLAIGPPPADGQTARVELKLDGSRPTVRVNGVVCPWLRDAAADHLRDAGIRKQEAGGRSLFEIPAGALRRGYNDVAVEADAAIRVDWVEIAIGV